MGSRPKLGGARAAIVAVALSACAEKASPPLYIEPHATPVSCPAPLLLSGGTNPAPDPGPACVRTDRESALPPVSATSAWGFVDLGTHRVGEVVDFDVPAGTASFALIEQEMAPFLDAVNPSIGGIPFPQANAAVPAELRDPSGAVIYSDFGGAPSDGSSRPLFFAVGTAQTGVLGYPNTSNGLAAVGTAGVAPGIWQVTVGDYAYECWLTTQPSPPPGLAGVSCDLPSIRGDGLYRLFLLTRPRATAAGAPHAIPETGTVDVAIHIVDAPTPEIQIAAADAPTHPATVRMAATYAGYLASAGLCVGSVTFYDAPAWARSRFQAGVSAQDASPCGDLAQLLTTSIPGAITLDLFLVTRITEGTSSQGSVLGVDGAIPGPATVNGSVVSGAVVSAQDLRAGSCGGAINLGGCGADEVAYLAAHESGHYLGLYHPTEADGANFDPLQDTPHCECSACGFSTFDCGSGGSGVIASRCRQGRIQCSGGGNLMFWVLQPGSSAGFLSPEQGRVARASPVVRFP